MKPVIAFMVAWILTIVAFAIVAVVLHHAAISRHDLCEQVQASNRGQHELWNRVIARTHKQADPKQVKAFEDDLNDFFPVRRCS